MKLLVLALLAVLTASCGKCAVDCAPGYEVIPNTCDCRPIAYTDGSAGTPLGACSSSGTCLYGLPCIEGCPASRLGVTNAPGGICGMGGRDTCGCGGVDDPCETAGTVCLQPACCDYQGICVTPEERVAICARPEAIHFDCSGS